MISEAGLAAHPFGLVFLAWLSTYLAHSTVALGGEAGPDPNLGRSRADDR